VKQITTCGPGLLIGIPTLGRPVPLSWAMAWKSISPPLNYNSNVMTLFGKPVDLARNEIAEQAVALGSKYLFFLGDDVVPPANALKQLIYRMEQNDKIGVVGGVYCSKSNPPAPLVFRGNGQGSYWDWKIGEFFSCTGLGMDCTLIRTDLLKHLSKPWFKTVDEDSFADAVNHAETWTEDLFFCKKVLEETDYEIYCDASIQCEHWDVYNNKYFTLPVDSKPMRRLSVGENGKRALDIGCGPINRQEQFPDFTLVRVDIRDECDPDYRCDVRCLPFGTNEFDLVFSSHVLEHFSRGEWQAVLDEWIRVLKIDGELILVLPNIQWAFDNLQDECNALNVLYGAQSNPFDKHYNGFWPKKIESALRQRNFTSIDISTNGYNMIVNARR
jgi:hypothetical protein